MRLPYLKNVSYFFAIFYCKSCSSKSMKQIVNINIKPVPYRVDTRVILVRKNTSAMLGVIPNNGMQN